MNIPQEIIKQKIYFIRGEKVMIDNDLARLYGVETKTLNKAVKRNLDRFPSDFMFQLNKEENDILRFHFGTSNHGGRRYMPYAFTEQGVVMLSSVLNSKKAIQVNIQIIRTFSSLRKLLIKHKELRKKIELMEAKYDKRFKAIFETLKMLIKEDNTFEKRIGFSYNKEKK